MRVARTGSSGRQTFLGRGTNMGENGIQAMVATELNLFEHVEIEVTIPYSSQMLRLEAEVRNRDGYNYGLQFLPAGPAERDEIKRSCRVLALMCDLTQPGNRRESEP